MHVPTAVAEAGYGDDMEPLVLQVSGDTGSADLVSTLGETEQVLDDASPSIGYAGKWGLPLPSGASATPYKGTAHASNTPGDTFVVNFSGTSVSVFGIAVDGSGIHRSKYIVDGNVRREFAYSPGSQTPGDATLFFSAAVDPGDHTLKVILEEVTEQQLFVFDYLTSGPLPSSFVKRSRSPHGDPSDTASPVPATPTTGGAVTPALLSGGPSATSINSGSSPGGPGPGRGGNGGGGANGGPGIPTGTLQPQNRSHAGAIAGGVVGGLAGLALLGGLLFFLWRRRRAANRPTVLKDELDGASADGATPVLEPFVAAALPRPPEKAALRAPSPASHASVASGSGADTPEMRENMAGVGAFARRAYASLTMPFLSNLAPPPEDAGASDVAEAGHDEREGGATGAGEKRGALQLSNPGEGGGGAEGSVGSSGGDVDGLREEVAVLRRENEMLQRHVAGTLEAPPAYDTPVRP